MSIIEEKKEISSEELQLFADRIISALSTDEEEESNQLDIEMDSYCNLVRHRILSALSDEELELYNDKKQKAFEKMMNREAVDKRLGLSKNPKDMKKPSMMPSTPEGWARFIKQTENL